MEKPCKTALITGAAGSIGQAIFAALAAQGYRCLLTDRSAISLSDKAGDHCTLMADLCKPSDRRAIVEWAGQQTPALDLLINNAGLQRLEPFESRSDESIEAEICVNLMAPLLLTKGLMPLLQAANSPRGHVVSIVSLGGIFALPETAVYSAGKFGLRGAMLGFGLDAKRLGVDFSILNPSATESPMLIAEALNGGNPHQFMDPPQSPSDVAAAVLKVLESRPIEAYVRPSESWVVRLGMLIPNHLPWLLRRLEPRARRGLARYRAELHSRGLAE